MKGSEIIHLFIYTVRLKQIALTSFLVRNFLLFSQMRVKRRDLQQETNSPPKPVERDPPTAQQNKTQRRKQKTPERKATIISNPTF